MDDPDSIAPSGTDSVIDPLVLIFIKADVLLFVITVLVVLLRCLSSRRSRISRNVLGRYFLTGVSAAYFSLISFFFSYLTTYMSAFLGQPFLLMVVVILQFLKSNADMAALAVAAVASPTAGDDIDSQKIRPSMESLMSSLWVTGLVIYSIVLSFVKQKNDPSTDAESKEDNTLNAFVDLSVLVLWTFGVARMVLRFVAFQHANSSFAVGRNAQLIEGYMEQLQQGQEDQLEQRQQEQQDHLVPAVPNLIVTGERKLDVEESPQGFRVKQDNNKSSRLVTLHDVWLCPRLSPYPEVMDLCLSFSLFKCLRRRFAGYRLAEAGSSWAFRFVCDGLLRPEENHSGKRLFKVISSELSFASDFYYSSLPVASLGAWSALLHFTLSAMICLTIVLIFPSILFLVTMATGAGPIGDPIMLVLAPVVALVTVTVEIVEMVNSVRSNWTKISMVGHIIKSSRWSCIICNCMLRCKYPERWKDEMGQNLLLKPNLPWTHLFKRIFFPRKNRYKPAIEVSAHVKDAVIKSFKKSGGKLSNGVATLQLRCPHFTWACYSNNTDTILVWYIATFIVETKCSSPALVPTPNMVVATSLSRYCAYLVAEVPDLLPDNAAWTKVRYQKVKKCIEAVCNRSGARSDLLESFGDVNSNSNYNSNEIVEIGLSPANQLTEEDVVKIGSKLGKQLVVHGSSQGHSEEQRTSGEEAVWEILAEFWSEMILYLAPSDNVKGHIEALRRGGELITLLWTLLLHAGITSRPLGRDIPIP